MTKFHLVLILLGVGCTGVGDVSSEGPTVKTTNTNNQTTNQQNTNNEVVNNSTSNNTTSMDMGSVDTGMNQEDMGSDPPDFGDPVYLNACETGPLAAPIPDCRPATLPSTGDNREDCVRRVNQFRWECQCLPPLQRWTAGEACADQQAANDAQVNSPHNGFSSGICSPRGNAQNECPSWNSWDRVVSGCLQQMWDEGPGEPFSAHGHYINMSSNNYSMVACGEGGGWFVQNFQ
jgi:hypothetical protein